MSGTAAAAGANLQDWVGREESAEDTLAPATIERLWATLDRDDAPPKVGDPLPPLAHWLFCLGAARQRELGDDGHEKRGHFIPPIELPRRMWASSRLSISRDLRIGAAVRRVSRVASVVPKQGRTGALVFVTLEHTVADAEGVAIQERQDVVYRLPGVAAGTPEPAGRKAAWAKTVRPDPVMLFRYSALTFNGHRIHYDHPYATAVEGYPGLIVHGPLIATMLVMLGRDNLAGASITGMEIRARAPLFDNAGFTLNGCPAEGGADLWAEGPDGGVAMEVQISTARSPAK